MADNTTLNAGTGGDVARSKDRTGVKTSIVALDLNPAGAESLMSGTLPVSLAALPSTATRTAVTPTVSTTPAYAAGDAVGGLLTFSSVIPTSGGKFIIDTVTVLDLGKQSASMDLVLFDQTFTASTDNAIFDPSDGDAANCLGFISIAAGNYADFNDWSIATVRNCGFAGKLSGSTSLFGQLVARGTPTYTSVGDIKVGISVREV